MARSYSSWLKIPISIAKFSRYRRMVEEIRQVSFHDFSVQGQFNISPDGSKLAYSANNSIYVTEIKSGKSKALTIRFRDSDKPIGAPAWAPDGKGIAYNRYVETEHGKLLQIFLISLDR